MTMSKTVLGGVLVSVGLLALGGLTPASAAEESPPAPPSQESRLITVSYKGKGEEFCLANTDGTNKQCVLNAPRNANDPTPGATIKYNTNTFGPRQFLEAIAKFNGQGVEKEIPSGFFLFADNMSCVGVDQGGEQTRIECNPVVDGLASVPPQ